MATRNRERRQKRRRRKKMKPRVRNGLIISICVLLIGGYIGFEYYMSIHAPSQHGNIRPEDDIEDDDSFTLTDGMVTYTVFNVGDGEAILAQCGDVDALIDAGPSGEADGLCKKLDGKVKGELDYVVLTSPEDGRYGGLGKVAGKYTIGKFIHCDLNKEETLTVRTMLGENHAEWITGGDLSYDMGDNATLFVIKPDVSSSDRNDRSLVTYFNFGTTGFVSLSNAGREEISRAFGSISSCDVLVLAQHGLLNVNKAIPSSSQDFIIASASKNGDAVSGEVKEYVRGNYYVTGVVGDMEFVSDGSKVDMSNEEAVRNTLREAEKAAEDKSEDEEGEDE